jgi:4-amino-4-deoxy-L-arabinose transferase-like glycosyltransferase
LDARSKREENVHASRLTANDLWRVISLTLLVVIALGVRLHHLDYESFWMDEIRQVSYYPNTFSQIVHDAASQTQPPLDYWIGHVVYFFSNSDFALRLPAAVFGVGAVCFITLIAAKMCSWPVGLGVGLISALLPYTIYLSQEARPYSIAVFLLLTLLWWLDIVLASRSRIVVKGMILFLLLTLFLYSRSLSPLVAACVLGIILTVWLVILVMRDGLHFQGKQRAIMCAGFALGAALLLYLPAFNNVLKNNRSLVSDTALMFGIDHFVSGIKNFDIFPLWHAFVAQTEPLTYPLLILLALSPYFAWKTRVYKKNSLWLLGAALLSAGSMLNLFIFQAKTDMPFRPPYAVYLLPLTLILAAATFHGLWAAAVKIRGTRIARGLLLVVAALFVGTTVAATLDFKTNLIKSDWRGACRYLNTSFASGHLFIFDSLLPYGQPTFNGFTRYFQGRSPLISMGQVPFFLAELSTLTHEPVVILFQHRDSYLTSHSKHPIIFGRIPIDTADIARDPVLRLVEFSGFRVIRLQNPGGMFASDAYRMLDRLLGHLPPNDTLVEMHLAAAGFGHISGQNHWQNHLNQARELAAERHRPEVEDIGERVSAISSKP